MIAAFGTFQAESLTLVPPVCSEHPPLGQCNHGHMLLIGLVPHCTYTVSLFCLAIWP
jgi:hypothetical protein